jgi:hypothetical protein
MDLILPFTSRPLQKQLSIRQPLLLMGSCFAGEIGKRLQDRCFNALVNPHGIIYNPLSMSIALDDYKEEKEYTRKDIFYYNGLWQSFNHHGKFSHADPAKCLQQINGRIIVAHEQIKKARWLLLTFGSAFFYRHAESGDVVANCHKINAGEFQKTLLSTDSIITEWKRQVIQLKELNPELNILFTVSPVRYVRDGLAENNRSKGILLDAVHTLVEQHSNCFYFPAYEIVLDELRDYRFFKEDLVHPNDLAVNYVWEKFVSGCCDTETKNFLQEYEPLLKSLQHRSIHEETEATAKFKLQLEEKIKALEKKYSLPALLRKV